MQHQGFTDFPNDKKALHFIFSELDTVSIINIGASTGIRGRKNGANYCSAKAGVIILTKCLALELAPQIKVNCIIPGLINTEEVITRFNLKNNEKYQEIINTIPLQKIGTPEDVFRVAKFIIAESSCITGQNLFVNGGNFMW